MPELPFGDHGDELRHPAPPTDAEIAARLHRVREGLIEEDAARRTAPDGEELEARLTALDEQVANAGSRDLPPVPEFDFKRPPIPGVVKPERTSAYVGMGVGLSVGYSLIGCTVIGGGLGKLIDYRTGGVLGQALGTLTGAIAGLVSGVIMMIRAQNRHPDPNQ
jgi:hypothetical protein